MYCTYTETLLHEHLSLQEVEVWDSIAVSYQPGRTMVKMRFCTLEFIVELYSTEVMLVCPPLISLCKIIFFIDVL